MSSCYLRSLFGAAGLYEESESNDVSDPYYSHADAAYKGPAGTLADISPQHEEFGKRYNESDRDDYVQLCLFCHSLSAGDGLKMGLASTSAAGAMSSSDKSKLDNADVTAYTGGNGVEINNHVVSTKVNAGNGLSLDAANGITMAAVSASTDGVGGSAGAMTAADKEKLDGFRIATSDEVTAVINAISISD